MPQRLLDDVGAIAEVATLGLLLKSVCQADMCLRKNSPHRHNQGGRNFRRALVLAGGLVAGLTTGAAERLNPTAVLPRLGYEVVELRRTGENHLFLFGTVNGQRRSCLVDTGWSFTTVSTNAARRLNPPHLIAQLKLGRVILTNESVAVQDMRVNGHPAPYDIVLGCDFLVRHHAVVDCANNRLYLRRNAPSIQEREGFERWLRHEGWKPTDLGLRDPPSLICEVRINGDPVAWLVDSGAMWSCLDAKIARSLNLRLTPSPNRIRGPGAARERALTVADLRQIQIGNQAHRPFSVAVFNLEDWGLGADGTVLKKVGGILGGGELAAAGALIDCHAPRLWLRSKD